MMLAAALLVYLYRRPQDCLMFFIKLQVTINNFLPITR